MRLSVCLLMNCVVAQEAKQESRFEKDIQKFEKQISDGISVPGQVMFIGSSSIRLWDLKKSFPDLQAINHGFGGSEISDSIQHFDRIVTPLKPKLIVMYAGDNDLSKGKSPEQVHQDFRTFVELVRSRLDAKTPVAYIAIKPSLKRWNLAEKIQSANAKIAADCSEDSQLTYLDIWHPMLGADQTPRPELFAKDGLHLNEEGYKVWASVVGSIVQPSNN